MINLGLKLGSLNTQYTEEIHSMYDAGVFQYIELFVPTGTYGDTVSYWRQFDIPFGIHAPHSAAGLNLANAAARKDNQSKIVESMRFADDLEADYIIFHSGTNGMPEEVVRQLAPFADERLLIENKPIRGLDGSVCVGCVPEELKKIIDGIGHGTGFCLDFGHAICTANTLGEEPLGFIEQLMTLQPRLYHLTDGDYYSELDSHLHYGQGTFPLDRLLGIIPSGAKITNEAKRSDGSSLKEFLEDSKRLRNVNPVINLVPVDVTDLHLLFEWKNEPSTLKSAFNTSSISFEDHLEWFEQSLANADVKIYIVKQHQIPVGQIRINRDGYLGFIDYSIDVNYRGMGFGRNAVRLLEKKMIETKFVKKLIAEVKIDNVASQAVFNSQNFHQVEGGEGVVRYEKRIVME